MNIRKVIRNEVIRILESNSSSVAYTGVFFDSKTDGLLEARLEEELDRLGYKIPEDWKTADDYHMTVTLGELPLGLKMRGDIGAEVELEVNKIGVSEKAIAFGVTGYLSKNRNQHITMAFKDKPVDSNYIEQWIDIESFIIKGYIKEFPKPGLNEGFGFDSYLEKRDNLNKQNPDRFAHLKWSLNSTQHNFLNYFIDLHPDAHREEDLKYASNLTGIPVQNIKSIINTIGRGSSQNHNVPSGFVKQGSGVPDESMFKWGNAALPASEYDLEQKYRNDVVNFKTVSPEDLERMKMPHHPKWKNEDMKQTDAKRAGKNGQSAGFLDLQKYQGPDLSQELVSFLGSDKEYEIVNYKYLENGEVCLDLQDYGDPYYDLHFDLEKFNHANNTTYEIKRYDKTSDGWKHSYRVYINRKQSLEVMPNGRLNEARNIVRQVLKESFDNQDVFGYKVMGYKDGNIFSLEGKSSSYPVKIGSTYIMPGGIGLYETKELAMERYKNLGNAGEVVLTFSYKPDSVINSENGHIKVKRAKLVDFKEIEPLQEYGDQTVQGGSRNPFPGVPRQFPKFDDKGDMIPMNEENLEEDYPSSFDMEHFKSLDSFAARIKYCEEHLTRLASGSSRIVYMIDDEKVLKLAKNKKGIAQNEVEIEHSKYYDLKDIVAETFEYHPKGLWVEMEYARKMNKSDFQKITGFKFSDFKILITNYYYDSVVPEKGYKTFEKVPEEIKEEMWEDETIYGILQYIGSYAVPPGDLGRPSSYGIVKRDGQEDIVIVDYGLTDDVHSTYYSH
jgi:hypothetical protein